MSIRDETVVQVAQISRCDSQEERLRLTLELAGSPDQWGRIQAAQFLGDITTDPSRQLLAIALNDRTPSVAEAAAVSLSKHRTDQSLRALIDALLATEDGKCDHLTNAVSQFGDAGLLHLVQLTSSGTVTQRYAAVRNLAKFLGSSIAEEALHRSLSDEEVTPDGASVAIAAKNALLKLSVVRR